MLCFSVVALDQHKNSFGSSLWEKQILQEIVWPAVLGYFFVPSSRAAPHWIRRLLIANKLSLLSVIGLNGWSQRPTFSFHYANWFSTCPCSLTPLSGSAVKKVMSILHVGNGNHLEPGTLIHIGLLIIDNNLRRLPVWDRFFWLKKTIDKCLWKNPPQNKPKTPVSKSAIPPLY